MPLLPPEPVAHPSDLFDDTVPETARGRWWVFQTRPRAEKAFARLLRKGGTAYFLPQYTHTWRKNGRGFESHLPLFPGYLFARGGSEAREAAFATNFVAREVLVPDPDRLNRELRSLNTMLGGGGSLQPEDQIEGGTPVLIVEGIYAGVEGRVIGGAGGNEIRLAVEISLLGRGVSVVVDRWMIKVPEPVA